MAAAAAVVDLMAMLVVMVDRAAVALIIMEEAASYPRVKEMQAVVLVAEVRRANQAHIMAVVAEALAGLALQAVVVLRLPVASG